VSIYDAHIIHVHPGKNFAHRLEVTFLASGMRWEGYLWAQKDNFRGQLLGTLLGHAHRTREAVRLTTQDTNYGINILNAERIEVPA
jgi:hypothetical protein